MILRIRTPLSPRKISRAKSTYQHVIFSGAQGQEMIRTSTRGKHYQGLKLTSWGRCRGSCKVEGGRQQLKRSQGIDRREKEKWGTIACVQVNECGMDCNEETVQET
jgi:hypothetical protein